MEEPKVELYWTEGGKKLINKVPLQKEMSRSSTQEKSIRETKHKTPEC